MSKRLGGLCLPFLLVCSLGLLWVTSGAFAQDATTASLYPPDTQSFPTITTFLDVHQADGRFYSGLQADQVQMLEDGQAIPLDWLEEVRPGSQIVIAIDPGPAFGVRNSESDTRYDFLLQALRSWGQSRRASTVDDWSLLITGQAEVAHVVDPSRWVEALPATTPEDLTQEPNLDTLTRALDLATDPLPRPGMSRAVLFITPLLDGKSNDALADMAARAVQQQIQISVWMVAAPGTSDTPGAQGLQTLASETGGQFFAFSGNETLPNPETDIAPLRSIYSAGYTSHIDTSGTHELAARIETPLEQITTTVQTVELNVQPPNPVFISPVLEISRRPPPSSANEDEPSAPIPLSAYQPTKHTMQVLVEFPDQRPRPLTRTALYVDGQMVAENTNPPFDQFTWDLRNYQASREHVLQVKAEDALGLSGETIETVVQVNVEQPARSPWAGFQAPNQIPVLVGLGLLVTAAMTWLLLVLSGRLQPRPLWSRPRRKQTATVDASTGPEEDARRLPNWVNRLHWPQRRVTPQAYAFLSPVSDDEYQTTAPTPLTADELTLGTDPNQATLVIQDASVEGLHARLLRQEDGVFRLYDEGSVAGTWINYFPVSSDGSPLQHGDLVHFGRACYRFTLRQPQSVRKPVITLLSSNGNIPEESAV